MNGTCRKLAQQTGALLGHTALARPRRDVAAYVAVRILKPKERGRLCSRAHYEHMARITCASHVIPAAHTPLVMAEVCHMDVREKG